MEPKFDGQPKKEEDVFFENRETKTQLDQEEYKLFEAFIDGSGQEEAQVFCESVDLDQWKEFFQNPETKNRFEALTNLQKIYVTAYAMSYLHNSPEVVADMLKGPPVVLLFLKDFYNNNKNNQDFFENADMIDEKVFLLGAYLKFSENKNFSAMNKTDKKYWFMADRLNKARDLLVVDVDLDELEIIKQDYGGAADGFLEVYDEACDIYTKQYVQISNKRIQTKKIWTREFEQMTETQKADFVGKVLACSHTALVFNEATHSFFTPDSVQRDNESTKSVAGLMSGYYNPAHSIIYRSHQNNSVYEMEGDSVFDRNIRNEMLTSGSRDGYVFHEIIIAALKKVLDLNGKHDRLVDLITEFWSKNRNPIFGGYVAEALSHLDPNRAAFNLLKLIREEKGEKNHLSSILYRIEFGQIGISEEGVRYLEKIYDLGEYNNPEFYVERLTPNGEVGIFNEEKELVKYFELGDITSEEEKVKAQVLDFVYDTLFYPKEKETEEEKVARLKYLEEFKTKYYKLANNTVFSETGVRLNNLTFKEQGSFMQFMSSIEDKDKLKDFVNKYRESGMRTFISMQHGGPEMGDKILELGKKLPENVARSVFAKYAELVDSVDETIRILEERFGRKADSIVINSIQESLLKKGRDLLVEYSTLLAKCDTEENCTEVSKDILIKLEKSNRSAVLLGSAFRTVVQEGINLEQIKGVTLETINNAEGLIPYKEEMLRIFRENRSKYPKELLEKTLQEFNEAIDNPNNKEFFILKDGKDILAFARFDQLPNGNLYGGSLNALNELNGLAIGAALAKKLLKEKSKKHTIEVMVYEKNPMLQKYLTEYGFKEVEEIENYHGTGQKFYKLEILKGSLEN
jgi:ribosomal protein S18 acetylase RimI-like enzyme